jgi:hypothetical protein
MIKLGSREMKKLSRVLTVCLCSAPLINFGAHGVVATNSGHNLTAYNPSNTYNNQWNTMVNGRADMAQPNAKADFGNCNAVVLRCATPKCANGGCVDANVATAIVAGCVESNNSCKQYGNELVSYMAAQLVANSTAKVNAQNAAAAAAAQNAQSEETAQQIAQMQSNMQQQMAQMQQQMLATQQQMAMQNAETQQQLQAALAEQREQNAAAMESLSNAATANTVSVQSIDVPLTTTQETAIDNGISADVLVRQQVTGKIMTAIEDADTSLAEVKKSMTAAFEYAGCDSRGNNCSGPKRVKKFRELALDFIDPYDNVADKIYDALDEAALVGVDITPIYMMLSDSCKEWANFLCPYSPNGGLEYDDGVPMVCEGEIVSGTTSDWMVGFLSINTTKSLKPASVICREKAKTVDDKIDTTKYDECMKQRCKVCTVNKKLTKDDDIYNSWVEEGMSAAEGRKNNSVVVGCASKLVERSGFLGRRAKRKNGAGIVDIEFLDTWLTQTEPSTKPSGDEKIYASCYDSNLDIKNVLETARLSKSISTKTGQKLCVSKRGGTFEDETCPYINPIYAICDTHVYNIGEPTNKTTNRDSVHEMIGLKTTVISQQMYKQYEYLAATLRRLKTHLEKAVFQTTLEASGAKKDDDSGSSSSWSTSRADKEEGIYISGAANCYNGDTDTMLNCLQSNLNAITGVMKSQRKNACMQLVETATTAEVVFESVGYGENKVDTTKLNCDEYTGKTAKEVCQSGRSAYKDDTIRKCVNGLKLGIAKAKRIVEQERNRSYRW